MFDARLACLWFCLPTGGGRSSSHTELAKSWTLERDVRHLEDGVLQWSRSTALKVGDEEWFRGVETLKFQTLQAIVPLGPLIQDDLRVFAFVTPFASALKSFQTCLASFVKEGPTQRIGSAGPNFTTALHVDLRSFVTSTLREPNNTVSGVEGITPTGLQFAISANKDKSLNGGDLVTFLGRQTKSVSIILESNQVTIYSDCTLRLDDVGSKTPKIRNLLSTLFKLTKPHILQAGPKNPAQSVSY